MIVTLRLLTTAQQDDWDEWLTIASAVHNDPHEFHARHDPKRGPLRVPPKPLPRTAVDTRMKRSNPALDLLFQKRAQATAAINKAAKTPYVIKELFRVGDQVWLDGKNLILPYQSNKLAPRRQGPFRIRRIISPVAFQLELPTSWRIHDVFHASLLTAFKEVPRTDQIIRDHPQISSMRTLNTRVEAIINHRFFGQQRRLQYLIKWKGYHTVTTRGNQRRISMWTPWSRPITASHPLNIKATGK